MAATDRNSDVVLVTGSSGYIGRPLVRRLARSFRMVGFDREGWPNPPKEDGRVPQGAEEPRDQRLVGHRLELTQVADKRLLQDVFRECRIAHPSF